jgi:SAM-dependent methyltransferase
MTSDTRSAVFDEAAELYDAIRPGYPDALVEAVATLIPAGGRILEIGVGTGQATLPFARRGYSILGLEPGAKLAALASRNLAAFPAVEIRQARFEEWPLQTGAFDLVFSATAFHWISPEVRYARSAAALKAGGHLALWWNLPSDDDPLFEALQSVYERAIPEMTTGHRTFAEQQQSWSEEIGGNGHFEAPIVLQFPWSRRYTTAQYLLLLETYSDHRTLPEASKRALYTGIAGVLDRNGGAMDKPYVAVLYIAKRRIMPESG